MRGWWFVLVVMATVADASPKTVAFYRADLEPGTTWWCWNKDFSGRCARTRARCEALGHTCTEQKTAVAMSIRMFVPGNHAKQFDSTPEVYDSKEHCEADRRRLGEIQRSDRADPDVIAMSACASVGAKALPPLKPLPAGNTFWCIAYSMNGAKRASICGRRKQDCDRVQDSIDSGLLARAVGAQVQTTSACASQKKGWAYVVVDPRTRQYSDVYIDKETCETARVEGEPCVEVK